MLHFGQHHQVTTRDISAAPTISDEVDTLAGIARKNDLLALAGIDEAGHFHTRLLHCCRRFLADLVNTAMNIGMIGPVVGAHGINDSIWLLRTRRAVKIHKWFPMHLA